MSGLIWRFVARRFITSMLVLWAVMTLVFLLISQTPGNVAMIFGGLDARELGLDQPLAVQYGRFMSWRAGIWAGPGSAAPRSATWLPIGPGPPSN